MRRRSTLVALLLLVAPAAVAAQGRQCNIVESGRIEGYGTGETATVVFHDPFLVRCTDGAELRAQQGTLNQAIRELHLVGQVFFQDANRTLTSDEATYASQLGRLWARGNVVFTNLEEGSTLRGPELEYYRETETRPVAEVIAVQRPHLTLRSRGGDGDQEPLELDADRVVIIGEDQLTGTGSVVITRTDLTATGEDVRYDGTTEDLELRGGARIVSDEYRLTGDVIDARLTDGGIEYVAAETGSELASEDLTVTAPSIQLFFADDLLQRTVARGRQGDSPSDRAVARAETFRLEADSLDATLPGQRLHQVIAVGRAVGERLDTLGLPLPDSAAATEDRTPLAQRTGPALIQHDWIRGDTVIGMFEPADTAATPAPREVAADSAVVLKMMVAKGAAQSLYRVERPDTGGTAPAGRSINFLSGDTITLRLTGGEVDQADVQGVRRGLYLEPAPATEQAPASDTAPAPAPTGAPGAGGMAE